MKSVATGPRAALQILHFLAPVGVVLYYVAARTLAVCFLHKSSKHAKNTTRRYTAISLLTATCATFIGQAITYFTQSWSQPGIWVPQDAVVYIILSTAIYASLILGLAEGKEVVWHPYLGTCVAGLAFEIGLAVLQALSGNLADDFVFMRLVLNLVRSGLLVIFCLSESWHALHERRHETAKAHEIAPLLSNRHEPAQAAAVMHYGALLKQPSTSKKDDDSDSDDDDVDLSDDEDDPAALKELKQQQRKRLQEKGSWLGYVKEFKIFIPMLLPSKDRFVQGCLAVIGLVLVVERFLNVLLPRQLGIIIDQLGKGNGHFPMHAVIVWAFLAYLDSAAGLSVIQSLAEIPVQQFAYKQLGVNSFAHVMGLSMNFHNEKNSGELIRAVEQGQNLEGLLEFVLFQVAPMWIDLLIAFVYVWVLFDVYMSVILLLVGIAYVWVGAKTTSWSVRRRRRFNAAARNEAKVQNEAINSWATVSHFNRNDYECDRYSKTIDEFNKAEKSFYLAYFVGGGAQSIIMLAGRLAAMSLAIYRVSQGTVPVGNLVALTSYWRSIESPLAQISWSVRRVSQMLTDSERLLQLFQTKPDVFDAPDAPDISIDAGEVVFDSVSFSYDPRKPTLQNISFTAKPGQTIALVGETGGGKSTILNLLYRYYDVSSGSVRIDGQNIRSVTLDSLRNSFGMVPQAPALFNISILENVRYARLDATDDEVKDACRAAAIHDKIETFPDGYKSTVGERGVKLSGGELQRVSIARAILRQPKIVLLDEATSQVDAETEAVIHEGFKRLTANRTTFIIAHRLSTIQHADLILVINEGQVIERGTHEELFRQKGKYTALWSKQLSREVEGVGAALDVDVKDPAVLDVIAESVAEREE